MTLLNTALFWKSEGKTRELLTRAFPYAFCHFCQKETGNATFQTFYLVAQKYNEAMHLRSKKKKKKRLKVL